MYCTKTFSKTFITLQVYHIIISSIDSSYKDQFDFFVKRSLILQLQVLSQHAFDSVVIATALSLRSSSENMDYYWRKIDTPRYICYAVTFAAEFCPLSDLSSHHKILE